MVNILKYLKFKQLQLIIFIREIYNNSQRLQFMVDEKKMEILKMNSEKISCFIGNSSVVYAIYEDLSIQSLPFSIRDVEKFMSEYYFERVNFHAIINTKHFASTKGKRTILLKNGIHFKVSRKKWDLFN